MFLGPRLASMKKIFFSTGFIVLLFVVYGIVNGKINKDYYDHKPVKLKDKKDWLILKRNSELAILTLSDQSIDNNTTHYEWFVSDESTFDLTDTTTFVNNSGVAGDGVVKGKLTPIEFEDYRFYWSPHTNGEGFVYLNYYPEFNEEKGAFLWTIISGDSLTTSLVKSSVSSMEVIHIKKKSFIKLFSG